MNKYCASKDGYIVFEDGGVNPMCYGASERWFQDYDKAMEYAIGIVLKRVNEFKDRIDYNSVVVYEGSEEHLKLNSVSDRGRTIFQWNNYGMNVRNK